MCAAFVKFLLSALLQLFEMDRCLPSHSYIQNI